MPIKGLIPMITASTYAPVKIGALLRRKEVIQPQVPLRLPCYDFTPVIDLTVVGCLLERLAHQLEVILTPMA